MKVRDALLQDFNTQLSCKLMLYMLLGPCFSSGQLFEEMTSICLTSVVHSRFN